jgi:hypothetical protein
LRAHFAQRIGNLANWLKIRQQMLRCAKLSQWPEDLPLRRLGETPIRRRQAIENE